VALGEEPGSAGGKALEARQAREQAALDARLLLEQAQESARRETLVRHEAERAREERAGLAGQLTSAEDTARQVEARLASSAEDARRLAHLAGEAAAREAQARRAEEEALAEAARTADEIRREAAATRPQERDRPPGPPLTLLLLGGLGSVIVAVVIAAWVLGLPIGAEPPIAEPASPDSTVERGTGDVVPDTEGLSGDVVPDTEGLSALDARRRLIAAGFTLAEVVPTPGTPGQVVRSAPATGRHVTPGTPVTLYIGVKPNRYEREAPSTFRPR
jgi:hypothetical protein